MLDIKPYISVVIPTYNRSTQLSRCLDSLFNQTYPKDRYEIIIINDGSKDNTENVLREYEKKAPCVFIWGTQGNQGIATATNSGISRSKGDFVCFTGDDCIPENDWISQLVDGFQNDRIGAVGGKVRSYQINTPIQQFIVDARILDQEGFIKRNTLITGNAAYRKQVLKEIKGFDNFLIACVDLDLSIRTQLSGYSIQFTPESVVYHDHPASIRGLFFQQYRNGKGYVQLHRKYAKKYNLVVVSFAYGFQIIKQFIRFPFALFSVLISKKNKDFVLYPLFYILCEFAMIYGIVRETLLGEKYPGDPIYDNIDFFIFMDKLTISFLWQRLKRKLLEKNLSFY
jgi:cellulose synthase/poly-beta-1,6-N-acetylglucosamine synthase-like glycosyltransferase